ncbi:glycosyltransferase family 2 protein [Piscinibacter defluvii]|uniref:glycosyltransferase family 2 protein n=1 Tax=Piscinibacter defluvii TaxID=1796922 RepID=UPI000FDEF8C1|nr:glycosyltransferase family 2 protein [Piscinibacter defluvii]
MDAAASPSPASAPRPRVSVGMPAYNAEQTIRGSLDALLAQTLADFELIVSDNASTDGTWAIIGEYAARDPRIVAIRQPKNIGANGNYSAVFRRARAPFFKWASSNDWCAPTLLERCVERLEQDASIVLAAPRTRLFSGTIDQFAEYERDYAFMQEHPAERFVSVGKMLALNNILNGVIRTEALARTRLIEHYVGADVILIGHLALLGKLAQVDEPLFYRRMDRETATQLMSAEALHRHHYPVRTRQALFPAWRRVGGWLNAVFSSRLPASDAAAALSWTLRNAYWSMPALGRDLLDAAAYVVRR